MGVARTVLGLALGAPLLFVGLYGCSTPGGIQLATGEPVSDVMAAFEGGDARLTCGMSCAGVYGAARRRLKALYENELWKDLALEVARIGHRDDQAYFYLGRAAEGLGYMNAARTYYNRLALANDFKCGGFINVCDGLVFPRDIWWRQSAIAAHPPENSALPVSNDPKPTTAAVPLDPKPTTTAAPLPPQQDNRGNSPKATSQPSSPGEARLHKTAPQGVKVARSPKAVTTPWAPTALPLEGGHLPANYTGLDHRKFLELFRSKVEGLKKGEFETSAEFEQRTANTDILLAPINTSDLYAFRVDNVDIKYDADSQVYEIGSSPLSPFCRETYSIGASKVWVTCKLAVISRQYDRYTGTNAYGASSVVERTIGSDFALAFRKDSPILKLAVFYRRYPIDDRYAFQDKISVPLEKARSLGGSQLTVLFVGRVSDAQVVEGRGRLVEPKLSSPVDILITEDAVPFDLVKIIYYVIQTGEILEQKSSSDRR